MRNWAIIGCGYVGKRLARRLLCEQQSVHLTATNPGSLATLREQFPDELADCCRYELGTGAPPQASIVVLSAPPTSDSPSAETHLAAQLRPNQRLVYLSTTGVFARGDGQPVTDEHPCQPASKRGQMRLDVEEALAKTHNNTTSLRIPSIYGPGRGVPQRMLDGNYRLIGAADTLVSRIYVDDLVSAIVLLGKQDTLERSNYVIGDEEPCSSTEFANYIAQTCKLPAPPRVEASSVPASTLAMLSADRGILPNELRKLGWVPKFPTYREGLVASLAST